MLPSDWLIPKGVKLAFTQRQGGVSQPPFDSLNLGTHVGDSLTDVMQNRAIIRSALALPCEPAWLEQVHGVKVVDLDNDQQRVADGSFCQSTNHVCAVLTADCLPVLICDKQATQVAAVHAGWRGLCDGIIEAAIGQFDAPADQLLVYLGPCIGATAFEVGDDVRQQFIAKHLQTTLFFSPRGHKYMGDLQGIARYRIEQAGVSHIFCLSDCTYTLKQRYFSYRREPITGRMASLIWLEK